MRAVFRLRKRVRKRPLKIVARYRERSLARLGIHAMADGTLTSPFSHRMTSEKLRPTFGKMVGLWRAHYGLSEVLELLEQKRTEEAAATVVQLLKSLHQAANLSVHRHLLCLGLLCSTRACCRLTCPSGQPACLREKTSRGGGEVVAPDGGLRGS